SAVARRALEMGARIVNDQWGLQGDAAMADVAAAFGAIVVAMHNQRGHAYGDLMTDIAAFFEASLARAEAAGLGRRRVILDPGFGFGKTAAQNLDVLRRLGEFRALGRPILIGTSRKSMIGHALPAQAPHERVEGTAATVALGVAFGADIVRVHDVRAMARVVRMADAVVRGHPTIPSGTTVI
ncbi:MAG: dihydropteroate synthase, partial [Gemmatimonadaceae bacterium]